MLARPPVWLMRQAGRYLPEYRALKARHDFLTLARTPELAAEVTLQPLRRFPLDAAIIFSDILVVPEALGQGYHFRESNAATAGGTTAGTTVTTGSGIAMDFLLDDAARIRALDTAGVAERLAYVAEALRLVRRELGDATALLGFAGAPWTLATYMVDGGGATGAARLRALAAREPSLFALLMEKISDAVAAHLNAQIAAGADAVQLFDTWGALCLGDAGDGSTGAATHAAGAYETLSLRWLRRVVEMLPRGVPVIVFAKGMEGRAGDIAALGTAGGSLVVVSAGHGVRLSTVAAACGGTAVQGNLDPALLRAAPEDVRAGVREILDDMRGRVGHIFNLGHGITPDARIECVAALVDEVRAAGAGDATAAGDENSRLAPPAVLGNKSVPK
jgi:uroporphyrinogen decarboxylase